MQSLNPATECCNKELVRCSDISVTAKIYTHMVDEVFEQNRKRLAEYTNQKEQKSVNE